MIIHSRCKRGMCHATGDALRLFVHFEEVRLDVEVAENGRVTILACDGRAVQR